MLHEAAPCTCGLLYGSCGGGCSLLFAAAAGEHHQNYKQWGGDGEAFSGPYGVSVDCTLSLGTPSTRRAEAGARAPPAGGLPCWEAAVPNCNGRQQESAGALAEANAAGVMSARRCANCDTTSTPLWRNGPRGPKSLCNACGIRYKKEERRAAAAAVAPTSLATDGGVEYAYGYARQPQQWGCYGPAAVAKAASFGMFGDATAEVDGPCLPWGLGVMPSSPAFGTVREMPSLFQYY
ncbi:GATA transcription factor 15-like [Phragmites australis]|uniref:GATA transcription factor 15-like n=1 Tax=Phragmites australis TaxID=29695 RepID=UPI002D797F43|nr:GATA transcription factor 15-like [Phragmites australis]